MKRHHGLILPYNFRSVQPKFTYSDSPKFLILDISSIDFHFDFNIDLYQYYSPRDIIQTVASIPVYSDYDQAVVDEIEFRLPPHELDRMDFTMMDFLISNVVTWFYEYLNLYLPDNIDNYMFDRWLDTRHNELVMKRHDLY